MEPSVHAVSSYKGRGRGELSSSLLSVSNAGESGTAVRASRADTVSECLGGPPFGGQGELKQQQTNSSLQAEVKVLGEL